MYVFAENLKMVPALISFNFYSPKLTFDPIQSDDQLISKNSQRLRKKDSLNT